MSLFQEKHNFISVSSERLNDLPQIKRPPWYPYAKPSCRDRRSVSVKTSIFYLGLVTCLTRYLNFKNGFAFRDTGVSNYQYIRTRGMTYEWEVWSLIGSYSSGLPILLYTLHWNMIPLAMGVRNQFTDWSAMELLGILHIKAYFINRSSSWQVWSI